LVQIPLFQEKVQLVSGKYHPLSGQKDITFADLKGYGWIMPPIETSLRRQLDQFFIDNQQYSPPAVVESVSYLTNRALLVGSGRLLSVMPNHIVAREVALGLLEPLDFEMTFGTGPVGVSFRGKESLSPAGLAFLQALIDAAEAMPEPD
jgi:DNA-binding transcriptional LysR family regulator